MYEISKTGKVFNYKKVWEQQALPEEYFDDLRKIAKICYDVFNDPHRPYLNIGEYAKRLDCWNTIKEKHYSLGEETTDLLIDKEDKDVENRLASKEQKSIVRFLRKLTSIIVELIIGKKLKKLVNS